MGELEEKLGAILGDQEAMGRIMALAQSLGASSQGEEAKPAERPPAAPPPPSEEPAPGGLDALDPRLLELGMRLWREYQGGDQRTAALLAALRPFLKEKRRARLDRAAQIARLSHVIRVALQTLGERGEEHV